LYNLKYKLIKENVFQTRILYIKKQHLAVEEEVLATESTSGYTIPNESATFVEFIFLISKTERLLQNPVSKKITVKF